MKLAELVDTHLAVAERAGRLEKIERLAGLLERARGPEIAVVAAYLMGRLPQGRIGLGPAAIRSARPGVVAASPSLQITDADGVFTRIAAVSGPGSQSEKLRLLRELLARGTEREQAFIARLLVGELRQGALEGVMVDALARASGAPIALVRRAAMTAGNLAEVTAVVLGEGPAALGRFTMRPFRPVGPMLAQPAGGAADAVEALDAALLEYKLDGARIQVHKDGDEVRVYSRRLREVTSAVPEVVALARALPLRSAILDGEVLACRENGRPHPFQVTMRRFGRKLDVARQARELPLTPFLFDVMFAEGEDLSTEPLRRRAAVLESAMPDLVVPRERAGSAEDAERFLGEAMAAGHEGIMAKTLDGVYEAGSRGRSWLKIKPVHTLDLVVLAAEWGHGRRRGWLSNLHLGARDPEAGAFVMLGKTFKGMTDAVLEWQTSALLSREIAREAHVVHVRPELVAEIAFNGVQASSQYPGGVALRFARLVRYRDDKSADQADTIETVRAIHAAASRST